MIYVRWKGLTQVTVRLNKAARAIEGSGDGMKIGMQRAIEPIIRDAATFSPWDTGNLARSWRGEVRSGNRTGVRGVAGSKVAYGPHVEHGTRAGYRNVPPLYKVEGWAQRHGWDPRVLRKNLRAHGTPGIRMLRRSLDKNEKYVAWILGDVFYNLVANSEGYLYPTESGIMPH